MSGLLLHGVIRSGAKAPPNAPAHDRLPGTDGLSLLVSPAPMAADLDLVLCHDAILAAYAEADSVVPIRFGAAAADSRAALGELARLAPRLAVALDAVDRAAEFSVILTAVSTPTDPEVETDTGRDWLRARASARNRTAALRAQRAQMAKRVAERLGKVSRRSVHRQAGARSVPRLLDLACLVAHADRDRFRETAADLAAEADPIGLRLALAGPWPPYSFATETA